jgi:hypothetical protein
MRELDDALGLSDLASDVLPPVSGKLSAALLFSISRVGGIGQ